MDLLKVFQNYTDNNMSTSNPKYHIWLENIVLCKKHSVCKNNCPSNCTNILVNPRTNK